jgi:phage shock protein PspC (stress-responsive transcriptional regulator)
MIGGVCGGVAEYFDIDPTMVRILTVVIVVAGIGFPVLLYCIAWAVMPKDPADNSGYIETKPQDPPSQDEPPKESRLKSHWSFAVLVGALLVGIGVIALLGNLVNMSFWRFWPVILIVFALIQLFTPSSKGWSLHRAGGALVLLAVGFVLLALMLQVIGLGTFVLCLENLWPMLLIVVGLSIIGTAKKISALNLASSLLFALTLLVGTWYYGGIDGTVSFRLPDGRTMSLSVPASPMKPLFYSDNHAENELARLDLGGLREGELVISGGAVSASLVAGEGNSIIVQGSLDSVSQAEVNFSNIQHDQVRIDLKRLTAASPLPATHVQAAIPAGVTWNRVALDVGAADITADLKTLKVRSLDVQSGASTCSLSLGDPLFGGSTLSINSGIAAIQVYVPTHAPVLIYATGVNAVTVDPEHFSYVSSLDAWCSNTYLSLFGTRHVENGKVWVLQLRGVSALDVGVWT